MRPLVTPQEMAAADAETIAAGTPVETLMDRAGRAIARNVIALAGGRYGRSVVVVCGKGSNGGDGFAAARHLYGEGLGVRCLSLVAPDELTGAAGIHADKARRAGVVIERFDAALLDGADVVVDAILGTGSTGPLRSGVPGVIAAVNGSGASVVAADIPSGVDGTTGSVGAQAINADVTVAIEAQKIGTAVHPGCHNSGKIVVAAIGITTPDAVAWAIDDLDLQIAPPRPPGADKRDSGHVCLWAGSDEMPGAAVLAARGAFAGGAGYVSLITTANAANLVTDAVPEAVVWRQASAVLGPASLEANRNILKGCGAAAVGPGLGRGDDQLKLVEALLASAEVPLVVDADGLNVLADDVSVVKERSAPTVLTPHERELARLLDAAVEEIAADRPAAARMAARSFDSVVLLKGPRSLIAAPDGRLAVATAGGTELATAGTGDVLTGLVAALLARGIEAWPAAWCAAQMHGRAGEAARARAGGRSLRASDIVEGITSAVWRL